jgi:hypothetical protein
MAGGTLIDEGGATSNIEFQNGAIVVYSNISGITVAAGVSGLSEFLCAGR